MQLIFLTFISLQGIHVGTVFASEGPLLAQKIPSMVFHTFQYTFHNVHSQKEPSQNVPFQNMPSQNKPSQNEPTQNLPSKNIPYGNVAQRS